MFKKLAQKNKKFDLCYAEERTLVFLRALGENLCVLYFNGRMLQPMKQALQNLKSGLIEIPEVPTPIARPGFALVRTAASLISAGTERLSVEAGQKGLVGRAVDQPSLVKQVINRARTEGILTTIDAVRSKLGSLNALGYSAAGRVIEIGEGVSEFQEGDRVACAGVGYASHAEVLSVPKNLCARLPDKVGFNSAAFGTVGAIALQGVRLADPTLGEAVVVIGLGLIGQITVQLLKANGCRVFGIDLESKRIELARQFGADSGCAPDDDAKPRVMEWSRGRGADAVLITAATESNQPIELAGEISRQKGRVVVVGAVGLNIPRKPYFNRELTFKISMSYGPGRYDPEYEERGHDYPFGYVRWTEKRNLEAFLDLVSDGRVNVEPLITHRFNIDQAEQAYRLITGENESYLGVLLQYDTERELERRIPITTKSLPRASSVRIGLIGAGGYAKGMLLPQFKSAGAEFQSIATASGVTARSVGEQFGFRFCASGADEVIHDEEANLIVIATRHDSHAELACRALETGRHVFVEKPLALSDEELGAVIAAAQRSHGHLLVGFNRRFSPFARAAKEFFHDRSGPLSINYRVNAGRVPRGHWAHDPKEGGGRIVGEVCHFVDLMHFITDSLVARVYAESISSHNQEIVDDDSVFITLRFADGSNGSIAYLAEGDQALPKERIEILGGGKSFVIDDFRSATAYHNRRAKKIKLRGQDKGQKNEVHAVCAIVLHGKPAPITLEDLGTTTRATFRIKESLRTGLPIEV